MAMQLLPFQKIVDMPEVAQKHLCKIRGFAISSIVLATISMVLFVFTVITNQPAFVTVLNLFLGIPLMTIIFLLVLIANVVSLRNTEKWESSDVCCNLMRSRPACCTRSCSSNKHCCARLSCVHIAITVLSGLLFAYVCFVSFFLGCNMSYVDYSKMDSNSNSNSYRSRYYHSSTTVPETNAAKSGMCGATATFGIPTLFLMACLVVTTAYSACYLRQVENALPAAEVLPEGKMVTLVASQDSIVQARLVSGNGEQENTKTSVVVV